MTIVFSCCQPSLVVSYDTVQAIHSVWVLRKVTSDVRDHTHKCTNPNMAFLTLKVLFYLLQERCLVLRCTVDPKGTPLRLMVSGFLTSHLRNMPHLDCPGGGCSHGLASGTGPGFVMCLLIFPTILTKNIFQGCCRIKCFRPFMVRKLLLGFIFSIYLHSEKRLKL